MDSGYPMQHVGGQPYAIFLALQHAKEYNPQQQQLELMNPWVRTGKASARFL